MCGKYICIQTEVYVPVMYIKKHEIMGYMHKNTRISSTVKLLLYFPCRFVGRINVYHDRNEPTAR